MTQNTTFKRWFLCMAVIGLFFASLACSARESIRAEQPEGQYKGTSREGGLLNLRIEEVVKSKSPLGCDVDKKLTTDRRQLDPQLPISDRNNPLAPVHSDACKDEGHQVPLSQ